MPSDTNIASIPDSPAAPRPLDAIPHRVPGVEIRTDRKGCVHLLLAPPAKQGRLHAFLRRIPGYDRPMRFYLDAQASEFWKLSDGRRNLKSIAETLARRLELPRQTAAESVVVFTKMLMLRNLISLEIPPPRDGVVGQRP